MTDTDKRSVQTDALHTLGTIIGPGEYRDAVHIAVLPVQAGNYLDPGDNVYLDGDAALVPTTSAVPAEKEEA